MAKPSDLIAKLESKGPDKTEPTARRVRGLFNGKFIFDTTEAIYVWEHPYSFTSNVLAIPDEAGKFAQVTRLAVGTKSIDTVIIFSASSSGPLSGLVRVEFDSIDAWFVEEEQIYQHPKDPYKRVECVPSTRTVTVKIRGQVVAESSSNVFLYETGLPARYYVSPTTVDWELLTPSETTSVCPYKGMANYYNVNLKDGTEIKDAIWWYKYPTLESTLIAGRLCFYPDKAAIYIDGKII